MKCPIRPYIIDTIIEGYSQECIEEDCAWWNKWAECCAVLQISYLAPD